jgi:hypothetical protein
VGTAQGSALAGRGFLITSSIIVLIVVAFSDDLVDGVVGHPYPKAVLVVDVPLLILAFGLIWFGQVRRGRISRQAAVIWYMLGAVFTLIIDLCIIWMEPEKRREYLFWTDLAYYAAFLLLAVVAMAVNPLHLLQKGSESRERLALGAPVLAGTLGAYAAGYAWQGDIAAVDREYFAQISQIIPLLFVAVALEGRYFQRSRRGTSERGLTAVLLVLLVIGELMALSALIPASVDNGGPALTGWHQYLALVSTAFACTAALTALVLSVPGVIDPDKSLTGGTTGSSDTDQVVDSNLNGQAVHPTPAPTPQTASESNRAQWVPAIVILTISLVASAVRAIWQFIASPPRSGPSRVPSED